MASIRRYLLTPKPKTMSVATRMEKQMKNFKMGDISPTLQDIFKSIVRRDKLSELLWKIDIISRSIGDLTLTIGGTSDRASSPANDKNVHMNMDVNVLEYYHGNQWVRRGIVYK